ncbi:glycosyltransferase family 2 protein [Xiamenia xianingshaonis]|nr:glycosyltransferase family 2 protein [Xiamenia xianingshaonis]QTU84179.1 glycosyltransferase [Xiamenia xianingshaonis]
MDTAASLPAVSVVMPVYNCEAYLESALDSLQAQTFSQFELFVVDDGSTDATAEIAERYAASDARITVLRQEHKFAGCARNLGLEQARGDYVLFLDGDDYFMPTMLEHAWKKITECEADICVFPVISLNQETGAFLPLMHTCRMELTPSTGCFSSMTNPRHVLCFTTPAPWNKLFRRQFLLDEGLRFEATRSANDFCFVLTALAVASKIVTLDEFLLVYRQHVKTSLQATQNKEPFAFYAALTALREQLVKRGLFGLLNHAYINTALDFCIYNLGTLRNAPEAHREVFAFLKDKGFAELGILDKPQTYFYVYPPSRYQEYRRICELSYKEYAGAGMAAPQPRKGEAQPKAAKGQTASEAAELAPSSEPSAPAASAQTASAANADSLKKKLRRIMPLQAKAFDRRAKKLEKKLDAVRADDGELKTQIKALQSQMKAMRSQMDGLRYQLSMIHEQNAALLERLSSERDDRP